MFNIIVIGAEDTEDYEFVKQKLIVALQAKAKSGEGITIFTTGDSFIDQFTQRYNIDKYFFQTDWKTYGKNALKYRNEKIVENANAVYFFEILAYIIGVITQILRYVGNSNAVFNIISDVFHNLYV